MRFVGADAPFGDWRRHPDESRSLRGDYFVLRYGVRYYSCTTGLFTAGNLRINRFEKARFSNLSAFFCPVPSMDGTPRRTGA